MKMNKQDLMDMHAIQALTDADMQKVNQAILAQINSDVPMVNQLGFYIVQGGGKRIRPLIAVLAARALGYESDKVATCATFVEFIHTASLLHDDVVDDLFNEVKTGMMQAIREQSLDADRVVDYLMMAKYLEKVGDHAVNIAEWAIFRMTGDMEGARLY